MVPVRIREATSADDAALTNLECQSPMIGFAPVNSTQSFLARAKVYDEYSVFVAEAEERVIGVGCGALNGIRPHPSTPVQRIFGQNSALTPKQVHGIGFLLVESS